MQIKKPQASEDTQGKVAYNFKYGIAPDFSGKKVFLRGLRVTSDRLRFRIATGQLVYRSSVEQCVPSIGSAISISLESFGLLVGFNRGSQSVSAESVHGTEIESFGG